MLKRIVYINLLIVATTAIQILWYSPDGISSSNLSSSPLSYIEIPCMIPAIILTLIISLMHKLKASESRQLIILSFAIAAYWLFANYIEFEDRVASWSTFSTAESWYYTIIYNPMPIIVCSTAFCVGAHLIFSNTGCQQIFQHSPMRYPRS